MAQNRTSEQVRAERNIPRRTAKICENMPYSAREALKRLRTNVLISLSEKSEKEHNIIGITSAQPSEGKSTVSINLAYSLAEQGKSVILSTHILTDMEKLCDEVGFLNRGVIVKSLRPKDMMDSDSLRVTFAQPVSPDALAAPGLEITPEEGCAFSVRLSPDPGAQQRLFARLAELRVPVTSIHTQQQSLDAIFQEVCL